jgi:signal transduction histidine kinase
VWNLLSNAIKFTPEQGRVSLRLTNAGAQVEIIVSDTGSGIDPAFLPHVFERFRQAEAGSNRRYGGLGLGLAIVRHLVELHGGTVTAESPGPDRGATFRVRLPVRSVTKPADLASHELAAPAHSSPIPRK